MIPNKPPNVNIEVTRNFHAHVSPTKPSEDIELNSFRIDRVILRIPRKACASLSKASTKGSQLLQDLPRLSDESKTVVSKIPITVEDPSIQQIVTPLDIPASQFVHLLDNPSDANKTILGAEQLYKRDDWMGNMLQRIDVKAPKVSPRKKKKVSPTQAYKTECTVGSQSSSEIGECELEKGIGSGTIKSAQTCYTSLDKHC